MTTLADREIGLDRTAFARPQLAPDAIDAAARVLSSGWLTTGPEVVEFEREFAKWVGATSAVAVSSCTAAIEISLRALGLPPGAKVLTSTMTFCGAVQAIVHAGLRPVLVDVNPDTLMPDEETTAQAADRCGSVEAMVVTHYAGYPASVPSLALAAHLPTERVIEDAAHALGAALGDRRIGTLSAATCFSFYATKNLPIGEGGMITTEDAELADAFRRLRLHGMSRDAWKRYQPGAQWRYEVESDGLKANMTDLQAAIGRAQLRYLELWQGCREAVAAAYDKRLRRLSGLRLPARPPTGAHGWHLYVVQLEPDFGLGRDELIEQLARRGIDCSVHFIPVHQHPYFQRLLGPEIASAFPVADRAFEGIISLPFHPGLADAETSRVALAIAEIQIGTNQ